MFIMRHPCVLGNVAVNYGDASHPPSLILKLEPTSLESAVASRAPDDADKCRIAVETVLGMRYIHGRVYMHRDLKPSNILLSKDGHVRICGFGTFRSGRGRRCDPLHEQGRHLHRRRQLPEVQHAECSKRRPPSAARLDCGLGPSLGAIFEALKANNYDLFNERKGKKLTRKQESMKKEIDTRVLMIESYEFQHKNDGSIRLWPLKKRKLAIIVCYLWRYRIHQLAFFT